MDQDDKDEVVHRIKIKGDMDRHTVEALRLEIRRLAKRYGVEITEFRIEKVEDNPSA